MVKAYYDNDANLEDIKDEAVAVIGYGIQGRAQCLNMRDSGLNVIVGNRDDEYKDRAASDGFTVYNVQEAAEIGKIIVLLIPDETQQQVYETYISPVLKPGKALVFAHGFAIRYNFIKPPTDVDVVLLAPRMPGQYVRHHFLNGGGVPAFVSVYQDYSGRALKRVLALAKAIGATREAVLEVGFAEETELDHFSEHFVCPLIIRSLQLAYEVLVEKGYDPEVALMELYGSGELGEILKEASNVGLQKVIELNASPACQFGIYRYMDRVLPKSAKGLIHDILAEIKDGSFAKELAEEQRHNYRTLVDMREKARNHPINRVEEKLHATLKKRILQQANLRQQKS